MGGTPGLPGAPPIGLGVVGSSFRWAKSDRESLPEGRECLGSPPDGSAFAPSGSGGPPGGLGSPPGGRGVVRRPSRRSRCGREAFTLGQEWSRSPPRGPEVVRRPSRWVRRPCREIGKPLRLAGSGWEALLSHQEWSEALSESWEWSGGPLRGPGDDWKPSWRAERAGWPPRRAGSGR